MIPDNALQLASGFTFTGVLATKLTDVVDLKSARDIGGGEPIRILLHCTVQPVTATGATFQFMSIFADNEAMTTNEFTPSGSPVFGVAEHFASAFPPVNSMIEMLVPSTSAFIVQGLDYTPRYFGLLYVNRATPATDTFTAGIFDIYMLKDLGHDRRIYPAAQANAT
jgi:hypothetical protein